MITAVFLTYNNLKYTKTFKSFDYLFKHINQMNIIELHFNNKNKNPYYNSIYEEAPEYEDEDQGKNKIYDLPLQLFELTTLKKIDCSYNKITNIPKEIMNLKNLEYFSCIYNEITKLPEELFKLKNMCLL